MLQQKNQLHRPIIILVAMLSFASIFTSSLFLALFLAIAQESRGQLEEFRDFVPEACQQELDEIVVPCVFTNACFGLIPTTEDLAGIPNESEIGSCADVEAGLCPITTRCPQCKDKADSFFKCVILKNNEAGSISANVTELIADCPLDCISFENSDPTAAPIDPTAAPALSPAEAPAPDSSAPTDIPDATESTEASTESGAANMMASSGSIIGSATLFLLAWSSMIP